MLIGTRARQVPSDITSLLLDCHLRIRSFIDVALRLGQTADVPAPQVQDAAHRVARYFREALPLHVRDEEETLVPRLRGREKPLDEVLERMERDHHDHEGLIDHLIGTCDLLEASPHGHAECRAGLTTAATVLQAEFRIHLQQEEAQVIPAIGRLIPAEVQTQMLVELRQRRATART